MRWLTLLLFFAIALPCPAQSKPTGPKISQQLKPDCSIQSTTILTKVFVREGNGDVWIKIYESEVAVTKTQHAKAAKESEYAKAQAAARRWEAGETQAEPQLARTEPEFSK